MTTRTYDSKCYDLAVHFLQDHPEHDSEDNRDDLAREIQAAIEEWFKDQA